MLPSVLPTGLMLAKEPGIIVVLVASLARCSKPFGTITPRNSAPVFINIFLLHSLSAIYPFFDRLPVLPLRSDCVFNTFCSTIGSDLSSSLGTSICRKSNPLELRVYVEGPDIDFETLLLWLYLRLSHPVVPFFD
ncbi:uncharacterized protein BDV14DRAFT_139485 [Aspergillus stella-maris]|uniref:uncharacterized protein n=1 Tax=Aspergillus stella-maris TaxID=1810926 RepID=UPI003CCD2760